MTKYAAMIRGIGPGNPNMKGPKLASVFEAIGCTNCRPFLGSGNVLFKSDITDTNKLEKLAEEALPCLLGFEREVFIRSATDLQKIVDAKPFGDLQHENSGKTYLTVTFFKGGHPISEVSNSRNEARADTSIFDTSGIGPLPYKPEGKAFELVAMVNGALCCVVDLTAGKTPDLMTYLERHHGKHLTTRTYSTVTRLLDKLNKV